MSRMRAGLGFDGFPGSTIAIFQILLQRRVDNFSLSVTMLKARSVDEVVTIIPRPRKSAARDTSTGVLRDCMSPDRYMGVGGPNACQLILQPGLNLPCRTSREAKTSNSNRKQNWSLALP